jgi:hypothetical protein
MFSHLTSALAEVLHLPHVPAMLKDADIEFERPGDNFQLGKNCINLFLFDVRERTDLRSSAPFIQRHDDGRSAVIEAAPMRMLCSYLITAWIESGESGQSAVLHQQALLAHALQVFAARPVLLAQELSKDAAVWLARQPYPVELSIQQSEVIKNVSEFWTSVGGKLRPSFTVTATVTMVADTPSQQAVLVRSKEIVMNRSKRILPAKKNTRPTKSSNRR